MTSSSPCSIAVDISNVWGLPRSDLESSSPPTSSAQEVTPEVPELSLSLSQLPDRPLERSQTVTSQQRDHFTRAPTEAIHANLPRGRPSDELVAPEEHVRRQRMKRLHRQAMSELRGPNFPSPMIYSPMPTRVNRESTVRLNDPEVLPESTEQGAPWHGDLRVGSRALVMILQVGTWTAQKSFSKVRSKVSTQNSCGT